MIRKNKCLLSLILILGVLWGVGCDAREIDREAIIARHKVVLNEADTLSSLTLGNGRFAMTMDVTGLQTFPQEYSKGIPLGTQSEWGWHSFPATRHYAIDETLQSIESHGRMIPYARQWPANTSAGEASNYIRLNPHRIHLASVGWQIKKSDGSIATLSDIKNINQTLDLWKGELVSTFTVEDTPVEVTSLVGQGNDDILGVRIKSKLIETGRMALLIRYPYPSGQFLDEANIFDAEEQKRLNLNVLDSKNISILRTLDTTKYHTNLTSSCTIATRPTDAGYLVKPDSTQNTWHFFVHFSQDEQRNATANFSEFETKVSTDFQTYWKSGGLIDFGKVADVRAAELERRMVLSLYLTKINCGGSNPPQETGLTYNSWYGRPHMEMTWWHGVHFALWGHPEILEKQMTWYLRNSQTAGAIAQRQGFIGVRWQKMTDNNGGETVSSVGSYLIWQQPHIIYFAELLYRINGKKEILDQYLKTVEATADFMADFAWYDPVSKRYILGPGVMPAQERFDPQSTFNPAYELAYWRWGLETAQIWRQRAALGRNTKWDDVLQNLSPLPQKDGLYLAAENAPDSYINEKYMTDHPMVIGVYGMLPQTAGLDKKVMADTFQKIWGNWQWEHTWGWDFPMVAMTATRLGDPNKAIDALLMPIKTNTYLKNGHNFQNETLRIYLPGNGGFLTALAMMTVGTDETENACPGFPNNWDIAYEGLNKMP